ncbi:MAG: efflux RND transporter periplasmic adaptor subunit [Paracoccaceae bacterium]
MRLLSVLTAIVVVAALYLLVFQRDALWEFTGRTQSEEVAQNEAPEAEMPEEMAETKAVPVVAMRSSARAIDGAVILRGRTEAIRQVQLRAETSGLIVNQPLRAGAIVQAGDLICELDPGTRRIALEDSIARLSEAETRLPESQARLAEAQARLVEAEINDRASARLSEGGFASDTRVAQTTAAVEAARAGVQSANSGVEAARAGIQSAQAGVAAANNELEKLILRAPFDGLLETDSAEIGSLLQPGSLCATIIQLDRVKLVAFVPETLVDRVEVGATAGARLASGREVLGKVTFLSRSADMNTRTFRVDVEVDNPDFSIRDGQTAEIAIQSDGETAHLLPQSSLTLNDEGSLGVRIIENDMAAFAPVDVIRDSVDGIWISGLDDEVEVIVVGQEFVTDGVAVAVSYKEVTQ